MVTVAEMFKRAREALKRAEKENVPIIVIAQREDGQMVFLSNIPQDAIEEVHKYMLGAAAMLAQQKAN